MSDLKERLLLVGRVPKYTVGSDGSKRLHYEIDPTCQEAADRIAKLEAAITSALGDLSVFGEAFTNAAVECARRSLREALGRTAEQFEDIEQIAQDVRDEEDDNWFEDPDMGAR